MEGTALLSRDKQTPRHEGASCCPPVASSLQPSDTGLPSEAGKATPVFPGCQGREGLPVPPTLEELWSPHLLLPW